jgi:protein-tyrosine phosphatase
MKKELVDEVEDLIAEVKRWKSITAFCEEAVRHRLEEFENRKKKAGPVE